MIDLILGAHWYDQVAGFLVLASVILGPWLIMHRLDGIHAQNERIINLLVDIKSGRREL